MRALLVFAFNCFHRVFLSLLLGEPVVCTLHFCGFRHFRGLSAFRESSTQLLVFSCRNCLRHLHHFRDFRRFCAKRPTYKP